MLVTISILHIMVSSCLLRSFGVKCSGNEDNMGKLYVGSLRAQTLGTVLCLKQPPWLLVDLVCDAHV